MLLNRALQWLELLPFECNLMMVPCSIPAGNFSIGKTRLQHVMQVCLHHIPGGFLCNVVFPSASNLISFRRSEIMLVRNKTPPPPNHSSMQQQQNQVIIFYMPLLHNDMYTVYNRQIYSGGTGNNSSRRVDRQLADQINLSYQHIDRQTDRQGTWMWM